eukprot:SAG11_NODE_30290_length_302_cov_0.857143_1_plen_96_part_10
MITMAVVLGLMLGNAKRIQALWMSIAVSLAVGVRILTILIWANSHRLGQLTAGLAQYCTKYSGLTTLNGTYVNGTKYSGSANENGHVYGRGLQFCA